MKTQQYNVTGMSCAACSASVQRVVSRLNGVQSCDVNLITGKMTVTFDENTVSSADFFRVVQKAGFGITSDIVKKEIKQQKESVAPIIVSLIFAAVLLYVSMGQMLFENLPLPSFFDMNKNPYNFALLQLLCCLPVLYVGRSFFVKGIPLLFKGHPNMDSLVAIGAGASLIYSVVMTFTLSYNPHGVHNLYFESSAVVVALVMLGKFFEKRSKAKTAKALEKLMELAPDTAVLFKDGKEYEIPTAEIKVGDILLIKSGAKIPLDSVVINGMSTVNEAMLTGESLPIDKKQGDKVYGGSVNLEGALYVKVTHIGDDTTLAKIIKFVEEAQPKKAPISKAADKVAGIFVPVVIAIAVISAIIWLIAGKDIAFALKVFTSVLVIACPCALGLATPTAIMVGTGLGASNGILIRNGEVLEVIHNVKAVVFDKTGTLTVGKPVVTDYIGDENAIALAAACETGSNHPLARAIIGYADELNIEYINPEEFKTLSGKGVTAVIGNKEIAVGKKEFLEELGINTDKFVNDFTRLAGEGKSLSFVVVNGNCVGLFAIADTLKDNSLTALQRLKKQGIKTVILSGDNKMAAEYIGKKVEADEVYAEVLPDGKAEIIKDIRQKYGTVMMVGDGINDAVALTEADVGCAIGGGSDIAIESADIVLMRSDICDVPRAINLSRFTITNIKQNLFWAFCYNTICIPVAAGILYAFGGPLLNPMLAGLAMSFSSVFVVGNALRLRGKKL
ncbi:MAG: copper-translocating P-type ATPase [Clostridia bacterium]|nr:copper-translocating P-type ATPase [Clostridia bacterium]